MLTKCVHPLSMLEEHTQNSQGAKEIEGKMLRPAMDLDAQLDMILPQNSQRAKEIEGTMLAADMDSDAQLDMIVLTMEDSSPSHQTSENSTEVTDLDQDIALKCHEKWMLKSALMLTEHESDNEMYAVSDVFPSDEVPPLIPAAAPTAQLNAIDHQLPPSLEEFVFSDSIYQSKPIWQRLEIPLVTAKDKSFDSQKLGLNVDADDGGVMTVTEVLEEGMVPLWNRNHAGQMHEVQVGDQIGNAVAFEVSGVILLRLTIFRQTWDTPNEDSHLNTKQDAYEIDGFQALPTAKVQCSQRSAVLHRPTQLEAGLQRTNDACV